MEYIPIIFLYTLILALFLVKPKIGFLGFIFFISFDNYLFWNGFGVKIKIYQVFLLGGLMAFLLMNFLMKAKIKKDTIFLLLLIYWAAGFISLKNAPNKTDAYIILIVELVSILIYFLVIQMLRDRSLIKATLMTILLSGNFVALLSIYQVIAYNLGLPSRVIQTNQFFWGRPVGTFYESNYLGAYSLSIVLIIIGLLLSNQKEISRVYLGISLMMQLLTLLLSMTRGAWLGLFFGFFLLYLLLRYVEKQKKGFRFVNLAVVTLFLFLVPSLLVYFFAPSFSEKTWNRFSPFQSLNFQPASYSPEAIRWKKMTGTFESIKSSPLIGFGPGQAGMISGEQVWYQPEVDYLRRGTGSANLFLGIMFQRGLLGLMLFIPVLVIFFKRAFHALKNMPDDFLKTVLRSIFVAFCAVFFTFMFTDNHLLAFFWVYLGIVVSIINIASRSNENLSPADS
jgi:putative inorganic carbon (HCO3(-)) transporter